MRGLRDYRDRTVLITGASSGIGRVLAARLAREGARLALIARRADALEQVASGIRERGGDALSVPCDVADRGQVERAARAVLDRYGPVDLLVNNAGYGGHRSFLEWNLDDVDRMMRVNYLGAVQLTKQLLPGMVERGRGWIVFVASVAGQIGVPGESAYVASKFAMVGFAEALSLEVESAGVHVLTVCPGAIRTPFFDPATLARLPPVVRRSMVEPGPLVQAIVEALASGKRQLTYPRRLALAYLVRAMMPGFFRAQVRRKTLGANPRRQRL